MSETLRPWLRQYILEHAQNQALDMEGVKSTVRICQLIYFRTYEVNEDPNGPPGGLWAEISDGQWHIPVHIPAHSVDAIVRANGSAMTKLTGGIFRVSPMAFVCQCLPVNRSAIERDARLAMRVNVIEYVGSAGENPFKDPKPIMDDATVRTWVRALRGDHDAQQSFSNAVTEALLEEEQRRKANVGRKPSRNGSTIVAGLIPRERERGANQHQRKNSNPSRSAKPRETSKKDKAKERSVKEKGLAEYRVAWGKRSLKMKWYLVPDEQCEILKNIEFPTDEEAARSNLASRPAGRPLPALPQRNRDALDLGSMAATSPAARMTALPSSSPLHELPSSLPTQTATSAAMSPELGPPEELNDDDNDDEQIEWPTSPVAPVGRVDDDDNDGEVEQEEDKFVFATPRPPTQPIILVPNSDPSSRATNSQSQSQSQSAAHGSQPLSQNSNNAHGSLSQSAAQSSQQLRSSPPPPTQPPRSSAAPTHVSDTVLESSSAAQPPAADGNDSLTQSTSQSLSQPQPAQAQEPKPEVVVVDSVTESTESQSQPLPAPPPEVQVVMDVDIPEPEPEPEPELVGNAQVAVAMDDDDAVTEAFLLSAVRDVDNGGSTTRKRASEDGTARSPVAKRARCSAEPEDAEAALVSAAHDNNRGTGKRAREERTSHSPVAKRARRSAEPEDGEAEPAAAAAAATITTTRESSAAVSRSRSARARKTVDNRNKASKRSRGDSSVSKAAAERPVAIQRQPPDNHASKTARDDADAGPSSSKRPFARRLGLAIAMESGPFEPAANRLADVAPSAAPPVKTESPSPVQLQNRSSETRLPVPDEPVPAVDEEGSPVQPPHLLLQDVMDMLLRLGQRLQREADERARSSR